jgi:hypothetical protein
MPSLHQYEQVLPAASSTVHTRVIRYSRPRWGGWDSSGWPCAIIYMPLPLHLGRESEERPVVAVQSRHETVEHENVSREEKGFAVCGKRFVVEHLCVPSAFIYFFLKRTLWLGLWVLRLWIVVYMLALCNAWVVLVRRRGVQS